MRIGNNSQGIWQFLAGMNGGKENMNMPFAEAKRSSAGGRQRVFNNVKDAFYKYNGMSGDNEAEWEEMAQAKNNYYKTLKKEDRVAAAWTLGQLEISIGRKVANAVKEKVPGWTHGKPIPSDVLDEIFADESIMSMVSGETKGLDMKI